MTTYIVHFAKIGRANPSPRSQRAIRVEALDEVAAKAVAFRQFSDRTFKIDRVEKVEEGA